MKVSYSKIRIDCSIKGIDYNFANKMYKEKEYILEDVLIRDINNFIYALKELYRFSNAELEEYLDKNNIWFSTEHDCLNVMLIKNENNNYIVELKQGDLLRIDKTLQWRMFFTIEQLPDIIYSWEKWKEENNI